MAATPDQPTPTAQYNARVGIVLFIVYLVIYAAFVGFSAFAPDLMKRPIIAGVNLAVVYGFGLIVLAFAMAILYLVLCRRENEGGQS